MLFKHASDKHDAIVQVDFDFDPIEIPSRHKQKVINDLSPNPTQQTLDIDAIHLEGRRSIETLPKCKV
jgi:hypothetical protein